MGGERPRIGPQPLHGLGSETNGSLALIRELHVYGPEVALGQRNTAAAQHKGLGRQLLLEAERVAADEFGVSLIAILSGVGARDYYRSGLGYALKGDYMVKKLSTAFTTNYSNPSLPIA